MIRHTFLSERFMMGIIFLNVGVIFALAFPSLQGNHLLLTIDKIFIVLFIIEAALKIKNFGVKAYFQNSWNVFDFVIVVSTLPELFTGIMDINDSVTFILVFRLLRLIRLVHFLKFVPNMPSILRGLGRAFKASLFVFIVLFFMIFIFAVLGTHLYRDYAPQYFDNPLIASFTIFQMFTMEGWNDVPVAIAEKSSELIGGFARLFFVFVVLIGGMIGMSLANAIFVDEMMFDNNNIIEAKIDDLEAKIDKLQALLEKQASDSSKI